MGATSNPFASRARFNHVEDVIGLAGPLPRQPNELSPIMKKHSSLALWLAGLIICASPHLTHAAANLLVNGDFENEPNWGGGVAYDGGCTALIGSELPGWTIEPNHAVTIHIRPSPYNYLVISGAYSVNTDGEGYDGHNANFYQDFATAMGASYELDFDWQSWGLTYPSTTGALEISLLDTVTSAVLFDGLYYYDGNGPHPVHHVSAGFAGTGNGLRLRIQQSPESGFNDNTFVVDNFSVTGQELPLLLISQPSPPQATLSWPTNTAAFILESTPVLPASTWAPVTNSPVIGSNGFFSVTVLSTNAGQYFRLRQQ